MEQAVHFYLFLLRVLCLFISERIIRPLLFPPLSSAALMKALFRYRFAYATSVLGLGEQIRAFH